MQVKEFLVIELAGDDIENQLTKDAIRDILKATSCEIFENAIINVSAFKHVAREVYYSTKEKADFQRYLRERIAADIGLQALRDEFIEFSENYSLFETTVKGELLIFRLPEVKDDVEL